MIACRRFGHTGLSVPEISLGTVELGMAYGYEAQPDRKQASALLNRALDLGVNLIDTARAYGEAEDVIGKSIGGRRDEFFIVSKVPSHSGDFGSIRDSVYASLRALRTGYVDVMLVHGRPGEPMGNTPAREALERLRAQGLIRWIGASVYGTDGAIEAIRRGGWDCIQIAYSALDRTMEAEVLPAAHSADVGVMVRSVLLRGALAPRHGGMLPEALAELRDAVLAVQELGHPPELSYRYVLGHASVHTALVGTSNVAELEAALRYAASGPLPDETLRRIREINVPEWMLSPGNWPKISS